jgi:hypothetical protein
MSGFHHKDKWMKVSALRLKSRGLESMPDTKEWRLMTRTFIIEKGVSGGIPIWERPVGRNLKMRLETGEYPHMLTMRLDRMFRLVTDALQLWMN